ncbi:hypothetical protein BBJ28_00016267 [Nothophytophthora sp. Chile5]|nr:hypothetical protein BBJ28_00016267 [Nothophytophthora sp. Chile5]
MASATDRRRLDQQAEGDSQETTAEQDSLKKQQQQRDLAPPTEQRQRLQEQRDGEQEDERKVHEITESSSDESADETSSESEKRGKAMTAGGKTRGGADAAAATTSTAQIHDETTPETPGEEAMAQIRAGAFVPDPEEFYTSRNVADMHYLFTNDKLKEQPATLVLRSDPFCIPRVTDNVANYRPMLNPLSIFMGEEKLLPGYFRLDPSERPPKTGGKRDAASSRQEMSGGSHRRPLPLLPGASASTSGSSSAGTLRGKTSAFMGTMPRQAEFAEIPVSEKLFQYHEVFRPPPPPAPAAPASPVADRDCPVPASFSSKMNRHMPSTTPFPSNFGTSEDTDQAPTMTAGTEYGAANTSVSFSDAMLLSSIQHALEPIAAAAAEDNVLSLDCAADYTSAMSGGASLTLGDQLQPLQPLDSAADTLTNYLPTRSPSTTDDQRLMGEHYFDAPSVYNHANVSSGLSMSMSMSPSRGNPGSSTFSALLSPPGGQADSVRHPYADLFEDDDESQHPGRGALTFTSSLASTSMITPSSFDSTPAAVIITPQGGGTETSADAGAQPPPGAKKPRAKNVFRPCTAPGCTKGARGKSGLCQKHGGGKRCAAPNCAKGAQGSSTMCLFHGGGYRCTVGGCSTGARGTSGLCAKHGGYKRSKSASESNDASARQKRAKQTQPPVVDAMAASGSEAAVLGS